MTKDYQKGYLDALRDVRDRLSGSGAFNCGSHRGFEYPEELVEAMIKAKARTTPPSLPYAPPLYLYRDRSGHRVITWNGRRWIVVRPATEYDMKYLPLYEKRNIQDLPIDR